LWREAVLLITHKEHVNPKEHMAPARTKPFWVVRENLSTLKQRAVRGLALFNGCLHAYKSPSSIFWATCAVSSSEIRALCAQLFHPQGCRGFLRLISVTIDCSKNVRKSSVRITQR